MVTATRKRTSVRIKTQVVEAELARRGWTQRKLADKIETPPTYLSAVLNGHQAPGLSIRTRLMTVFGMKFDDLFEIR